MPRQPPRPEPLTVWGLPDRPRDWLTVWVDDGTPDPEPVSVCDGWPALVGLLRELTGANYFIARAGRRAAALASRLPDGTWQLTRYFG